MDWTWLWWLTPVALVAAYLLGMLGARAFRKESGPNRRVGDRRVRERRAPGGEYNGVQRRKDDRRKGDRRRRRSVWPSITVVASGLILAGIAIVAYVITPTPPTTPDAQAQSTREALACDTPVTWSIDTSRLTDAQATTAVQQLSADFAAWAQASGLTFTFAGESVVQVDPATATIEQGQPASNRHVFVTVLPTAQASALQEGTVGSVTSQRTNTSSGDRQVGSIVLTEPFVAAVAAAQERSLELYEVAYALGLPGDRDRVHEVPAQAVSLDAADLALMRQLTGACTP